MSGNDENPLKKMIPIYVVTAGDYSDYHTVAVFIDKKMAEDFVNEYNSDDVGYSSAEIEEWVADVPPTLWYHTTVRMLRDGSTVDVYTNMYYGLNPADMRPFLPTFHKQHWKDEDSPMLLHYKVVTRDHTRAVKVTNELRALSLAHGVWGDTVAFQEILRRREIID